MGKMFLWATLDITTSKQTPAIKALARAKEKNENNFTRY